MKDSECCMSNLTVQRGCSVVCNYLEAYVWQELLTLLSRPINTDEALHVSVLPPHLPVVSQSKSQSRLFRSIGVR